MPSWKKLIVSGSDARVSTLFTSGHLTSSGDFQLDGHLTGSETTTGSFGRLETDTMLVREILEATASHALTSSLSDNVQISRMGNAFTQDLNVMLGGNNGAGGSSGPDSTSLKLTAPISQNHLTYNVDTGRMEGVQNLIGTSSIATKLDTISHSKTSSFLSAAHGGTFYDIPFLKQHGTLVERDGGGTLVGHKGRPTQTTFGIGENRIRYNPVTMHLSASVSSSASFGQYYGDGSNLTGITHGIFIPTGSYRSTDNNLKITGSLDISGNLSGSVTSTGSFGSVHVFGMTTPNVVDFSASLSGRVASDSSSFQTRISSDSSSIQLRATNLENKVGQSLNTTDSPQFAGITIDGDITARTFIVSSSVTVMTQSFSEGSTIFGDTLDDTHQFTGSVFSSGSVTAPSFTGIFSGALSSSAQISDDISGSFTEVSKSFRDDTFVQSQSVSVRLASVEAGNIGDGSSSGDNTGDVTLIGTPDYITLENQVITRNQIDLQNDITGDLPATHLDNASVKTFVSGAFTGLSGSLTDRISLNETTGSKLDLASGSFSTRLTSVEASTGGQDLATDASPTFAGMTLSGSLTISGSQQSTSIIANNIQNGYPTSNDWGTNLGGSYFNNFTNETHVSEILRFIAGAMSHSLDIADAAPNSKFLNSVSTAYAGTGTTSRDSLFVGVLGGSYESSKLSQHWTSSNAIDFSTTQSYVDLQDHLISKGFMVSGDKGSFGNDTGTNPFSNGYGTNIPTTISTNADFGNFALSVTSVAGGSTTFRSSADNQLFGLGTLNSGGARAYTVRIAASQSYSDNQSNATPDQDSNNYHTHSVVDFTQNSFGTSNGVNLAKINTSQPAVIPAAFQDGKFTSVSGPISGRYYTGGATNKNVIAASGYYRFHDIKVGLQTGSGDFHFKGGSNSSTLFYLYTGGLPTDITQNVQNASISNPNLARTSFTATSRSLSGAPYILTATYAHTFSSEATQLFDPAYSSLNALQHDISTDNFNTIGTTSLGSHTTVNIDSSGVNTSSAGVKGVLSNDKATLRADGDVPHINDIAFLSSSFTFSLDSNYNNTVESKATQAALNYTNTFRVRARNWKNNTQSNTSTTVNFYDATLFAQPSASGSMAIYSRAQGYDAGSLTGTTEQFSGEDFRIQLNNNVTSFSGDAFNTSYALNILGDYDLQVKPGYLVDPGGSDGYWYVTGFGSGTYKYYIRRFQTSGTKNSMTFNVGQVLQAWNSTSNGVSAALLFESSATPNYSRARIYDPTATVSNDIETNISNDNHKNPFSSAIDLYGNSGGGVSSSTYTIPLRNVDGMTLSGAYNELYVILRYKSVTNPVTSITLSFS